VAPFRQLQLLRDEPALLVGRGAAPLGAHLPDLAQREERLGVVDHLRAGEELRAELKQLLELGHVVRAADEDEVVVVGALGEKLPEARGAVAQHHLDLARHVAVDLAPLLLREVGRVEGDEVARPRHLGEDAVAAREAGAEVEVRHAVVHEEDASAAGRLRGARRQHARRRGGRLRGQPLAVPLPEDLLVRGL
jgi:hypothetical protein